MNFDTIIVGAGPIGSTVAKTIAKEGYEVLILEEHPQVGIPQHCTGKISVKASNELNLPDSSIMQEVRGAIFYGPDMSSLKVERKEKQANIFNREILDRLLSEKAIDAGATLLTNARVLGVSRNLHETKITYKHNGSTKSISSRVVIGADGANSAVARNLGLYSKKKSEVRVAIQNDMVNLSDMESELVEVYVGQKYAPGFFAWIVPTGEGSAKVGLGVYPSQGKHLKSYLEHFIASHPIASKKLKGARCAKQAAHIIPIGGTLHKTVADGVLIVGDAAGQVKSTTGGGLYYGMVCAGIAGHTVTHALAQSGNILKEHDLIEYQNRWRGHFRNEIELSSKARHVIDSLTDNELNYIFNLIRRDDKLTDLIEAEGDIDWQSGLARSMFTHLASGILRRPKLLIKLWKLLV